MSEEHRDSNMSSVKKTMNLFTLKNLYFRELKNENRDGSERSLPGPIPASAVTCTIPGLFIICNINSSVNFNRFNYVEPIFKYPMRPLSEITNEQKRAGRSR